VDYSRPELADRLAADYVSGTLRGAARRRFEALLPAHSALRAAVRAWQERLMPLTLAIAPQRPSPQVWQRIEARIAAQGAAQAARRGWWARLGFWRGVSGLATLAALSLAVLLASPGPSQPPIVVVLNATTPAGSTAVAATFVASISGDGRSLVTKPLVNVSLEVDRALELWAVPPSGAPRSLGLISSQGATVVQRDKALAGAAALAVSLEPAGGSPTGAPTGPILYLGKLTI